MGSEIEQMFSKYGPFSKLPALWTAQALGGLDYSELVAEDLVCQLQPRPVLLVYGSGDSDVPSDQAQRMSSAVCAPDSLLMVNADTHGGYLDSADATIYADRLVAFFDSALLPGSVRPLSVAHYMCSACSWSSTEAGESQRVHTMGACSLVSSGAIHGELESAADLETSSRCHVAHGGLQLGCSVVADQSAGCSCKADAGASRTIAAGRGVALALSSSGGQASGLSSGFACCLGGALSVRGGRGGFAVGRHRQ